MHGHALAQGLQLGEVGDLEGVMRQLRPAETGNNSHDVL